MADLSHISAVTLVADTQTDVTGGGMAAGTAGAYSLNFCNDSDSDAACTAIYLTSGAAPVEADKIRPAFTIEARGWRVIQPLKLGVGWSLFVEADAPVSVQLIGRKEG